VTLRLPNDRLLCDLEPFVVAAPEHLASFDLAPFGLAIAPDARIDPLLVASAPFLELLVRLDAVTFGPEGMPMPRWLFLDGAGLPGAVVGLARRASAVEDEARVLLRVPDAHTGLVPHAMYIAVPAAEASTWVGHNLASVAEHLPGRNLAGLGRLTKALALRVLRASAQVGATQWASRALHVHARLGPLELLTAWTPAHGGPATLTYRASIDDASLRRLAGEASIAIADPAPDRWIDSADPAAMQELQDRLEAGDRFCIAGRPEPIAPGRQRVPVAQITR
jgi:hypothetical protein